MDNYKVLITASGVGNGLGDLTKYTNKVLLKVGDKAVISYIIDAYPKNTHFVVTLGHFKNQVKDFIFIAYPNLRCTFVEVDNYCGKGSSLGYSMLKASKFLESSFIYHASDTIVLDKIPPPEKNWVGGFRGKSSINYTSFNILNGKIQKIMEKGITDPDFLYIGLSGIKDYKKFWNGLKEIYEKNKRDSNLADYHVLNKIILEKSDFKVKVFNRWLDTGNIDSLEKARSEITGSFTVLNKPGESIFILNKNVVKFFFDSKLIENRVKRAEVLSGLVPKIKAQKENFFKYKYVKGELYADTANPINFSQFLQWAKKKLWKKVREASNKEFNNICKKFYYDKTIDRTRNFLKTRNIKDSVDYINEERVPSLEDIFKKVDFKWLIQGEQRRIHGDLVIDNIIQTKKGYILLDWRQDFGGLLESGDIYYDFSKLNHNLTINHEIITKNDFKVEFLNGNVKVDVLRRQTLIECQEKLFQFLETNRFDSFKVKVLTSLVWLNMSALHHHPFDIFLFYFGKLNLWKNINEKN